MHVCKVLLAAGLLALAAPAAKAMPVTYQFDLTDFRQNPFGPDFLAAIGESGATSATASLTFDTTAVPFNTQNFVSPTRVSANYDYISFTVTIGATTLTTSAAPGFPDQLTVQDGVDNVGGTTSDLFSVSGNDNQFPGTGVEVDYYGLTLTGPIDTFSGIGVPGVDALNQLFDGNGDVFQIAWFETGVSGTNFFYADTIVASVVPVPLPSALTMLALGLVILRATTGLRAEQLARKRQLIRDGHYGFLGGAPA